jgi:hypothetical protein
LGFKEVEEWEWGMRNDDSHKPLGRKGVVVKVSMDVGYWILVIRLSDYRILGLWVMGYGLWVMDYGYESAK